MIMEGFTGSRLTPSPFYVNRNSKMYMANLLMIVLGGILGIAILAGLVLIGMAVVNRDKDQ